MDLFAKSAQNNLEDVKKQIKELIENLTSDGKEREALSRHWNSDKIDAEQQEIKKWEKKFERLRSYPDNPSFEEEDEKQRSAKKTPTASTHQNDGKHAPSKKRPQKKTTGNWNAGGGSNASGPANSHQVLLHDGIAVL